MAGTRIKIMWEEQLVDPPIDYKKYLVNYVRLEKTGTEMATGCLRMMKSGHVCIR